MEISLAVAIRYEKETGDAIGKNFKIGTGELKKNQFRSLIFEFPNFKEFYEKYKEEYDVEIDHSLASLFAKYILFAWLKVEENTQTIFDKIEDILLKSDDELTNLLVTGVLEDSQNLIQLEGVALSNFDRYLKPETKKWWDDIIRFWGSVATWISNRNMKYTCPVCGYLTFNELPGSHDTCAVCGWEDDESQLRFPNTVGANNVTLVQAQNNFHRFGYGTRNIIRRLLFKHSSKNHQKDPKWRMLKQGEYSEEQKPDVDYGETYPEDLTQLYYWKK